MLCSPALAPQLHQHSSHLSRVLEKAPTPLDPNYKEYINIYKIDIKKMDDQMQFTDLTAETPYYLVHFIIYDM